MAKKEGDIDSEETASSKKESMEIRWIKYLINKSREQDQVIESLKKENQEMKDKLEILGQSVLNLYEKK